MNDFVLIKVLECMNHADGLVGRSGYTATIRAKNRCCIPGLMKVQFELPGGVICGNSYGLLR